MMGGGWQRPTYLISVGAVLLLPFGLGPYGHFLLASILVYALVGLSLSLLVGLAGQISIGHAGFWALGAYASAVATVKLGAPFLLGIVFGGVVGGFFGTLVALPALRVRGHYLAIATLGFSLVIQQVLFEWESLTGGRQGMFVPRPQLFGFALEDDFSYFYFLLAFVLLVLAGVRNFNGSHTGRALVALRMSETAAQCSGIGRARHLVIAFGLSGALAGVSGCLYAHLIGQISTDAFTLSASLSFLTMAVVGGIRSPLGAVLGAAYLTLMPEVFRELREAQMVVYGVSLIACLRFFPDGFAGIPAQIVAWHRAAPK
ncbi:branched-chain amino acid ABC transporter permease [Bradyrhizobium sp. AUGA SZCCT0182]|uniref:branched-chain amino acid ABC transporter permease n=1 Tax=Bradyrhizobium sp. AUGA SZCCT0182 TaxID=2807667 RepID=UPI001BA79505|nr:branched-chain amino acid ABC transporter permease [Bradyrhizobium sp. AUGA SZCCT0182]MBR1231618.1 branched-chain amino acid ABC transporter permease [Bradyrhizobium sp. AUGA SZCCT0182]